MSEQRINTIMVKPYILFLIEGIAPPLVYTLCLIFYYYNGHNEKGKIPSISEAVLYLPESRVFRVLINMCGWLLIPIFIILDRVLKLQSKRAGCHKSPAVLFSRFTMNIFNGISFFSIVALCSVNIQESYWIHMTGMICFTWSMTISFICIDYQMRRGKSGISFWQYLFSTINVIMNAISIILWAVSKDSIAIHNAASIFEYIGGFTIFFKILMIWSNLPTVCIIFRKE